jgi:cell division septal protein FtsQ
MWFKRKYQNRRMARVQILDVKLRSSQVFAARARLASVALGVAFGTIIGLYALWCLGDWALDQLVYENKAFAIQQIDVQTDGVISPDQLRRWSAVKAGENLIALDLARVKRDLELVPMIQSTSVERVLPNTLRIRVTERQPVAQINVPRPRNGGGLELVVFQVDSEGYVMLPLDPRQRAVPLHLADDRLPVISGINVSELQPGRRIESAQMRAALRLIDDFGSSTMAGLVDLKRIDLSAQGVLTTTTDQGSEVIFGLENFEQQLLRWEKVHEECLRHNKSIAMLDLAVSENTPLRMQDASVLPPPVPKTAKPARTKKKNV